MQPIRDLFQKVNRAAKGDFMPAISYSLAMNNEATKFDAENATLAMSNELKDVALHLAEATGGDPVPALIGAAMKVIKETMGDEHVAPLMQRMMTTIASSEGEPSSYN